MRRIKKISTLLLLISGYGIRRVQAQTTASFNFSLAAHTGSGWVNVAGDPSTAIRTGVSGSVHISSVATANWAPYNSAAAYDGGGMSGATFFPAAVSTHVWVQSIPDTTSYHPPLPYLDSNALVVHR